MRHYTMMLQPVWDRLVRWHPRFSLRTYKAALAGLILMAFAVPLVIVGLPFIEFLNGMAVQPKGKTQMTYGRIFHEELTVERAPVARTVPRGYKEIVLAAKGHTIEDAKAAGATLANPVPLTMDNLRRGQDRYNIFCIACHGEMAEGNGPVTGPNRFPAPPSLHTDQARLYSDGTIFHVITKGLGKMPAYADKFEPQDRWRVIHYLRALQRAMNPRPGDTRPTGTQSEGHDSSGGPGLRRFSEPEAQARDYLRAKAKTLACAAGSNKPAESATHTSDGGR